MSYSEDEIKRLAELREWLVKRINDKEDEVERLKMTLTVIDNALKRESFKPAVVLRQQSGKEVESLDVRQLKNKDNLVLGNAYMAAHSVTIVPISDKQLNVNTPPFQSFFIRRILEGMKSKDMESVESGGLASNEIIDYNVEDENGMIQKIVINNYRDKERLNEIINTAAWVFARMLEKTR
ncbi:MAG: hypothetical protein ACE5KA_03450 [Nitrososphaerales archaeon]